MLPSVVDLRCGLAPLKCDTLSELEGERSNRQLWRASVSRRGHGQGRTFTRPQRKRNGEKRSRRWLHAQVERSSLHAKHLWHRVSLPYRTHPVLPVIIAETTPTPPRVALPANQQCIRNSLIQMASVIILTIFDPRIYEQLTFIQYLGTFYAIDSIF